MPARRRGVRLARPGPLRAAASTGAGADGCWAWLRPGRGARAEPGTGPVRPGAGRAPRPQPRAGRCGPVRLVAGLGVTDRRRACGPAGPGRPGGPCLRDLGEPGLRGDGLAWIHGVTAADQPDLAGLPALGAAAGTAVLLSTADEAAAAPRWPSAVRVVVAAGPGRQGLEAMLRGGPLLRMDGSPGRWRARCRGRPRGSSRSSNRARPAGRGRAACSCRVRGAGRVIAGETGARVAFRPDRVYLGWQHAQPAADPGPPPARPPEPSRRARSAAGWLAAQRREKPGWAAAPAGLRLVGRGGLRAGRGLGGRRADRRAGPARRRGVPGRGGREPAGHLARRAGAARPGGRGERAGGRLAGGRRAGRGGRPGPHYRDVQAWRKQREVFRRQPQWFPVTLPGGHPPGGRGRRHAGRLVGPADLGRGAPAGRRRRGHGARPDRGRGGAATCWPWPAAAASTRWSGCCPATCPGSTWAPAWPGDALADVLAMAVAGSGDQGAGPDPAADAALLSRVLAVLGEDAGHGGRWPRRCGRWPRSGDPRADLRAGLLTADQVDRLTGLFGRGAAERVVIDRACALEARLRALAPLGTAPAALAPSRLRLAWLDRRAAALGNRVLASYLAAALTHVLRQAPPGRPVAADAVRAGRRAAAGGHAGPAGGRLRDGAGRAGAGLPVASGARPGAARPRQRGGGVHAPGQRRRRPGGGGADRHRAPVRGQPAHPDAGHLGDGHRRGLLHQHGGHGGLGDGLGLGHRHGRPQPRPRDQPRRGVRAVRARAPARSAGTAAPRGRCRTRWR